MASSTLAFAHSLHFWTKITSQPTWSRNAAPRRRRSQPRWRACMRASLSTPTPVPSPTSSPIPQPAPPSQDQSLYDVVVIGAGPAGLSISSALGAQGLSVVCLDPQLHKPWPNHYGVWEDEFARVDLADCATARYDKTSVYAGDEKIVVDRPYIRVDRVKLKKRFLSQCADAGVLLLESRVTGVEHITTSCSSVKMGEDGDLRTRLVVDCTGHALQFTGASGTTGFEEPWAQAAYGIEAVVKSHPFETNEMLLMDFRDGHAVGDMKSASNERPTFLYVFPSGEKRGFFEETSVIAPHAVTFEELKGRLEKRLVHEGVVVERVIEEEFSLIPMGGSLPVRGRVIGFGGAGGLVHPATGYMVGRTVRLANEVAKEIAKGLQAVGRDGDVEEVAQMAWAKTWSVSMLRQRDFLTFGAELLGGLGMEQSRSFFQAFFRLPRELWTRFLGYELDDPATRALFALWFFVIADNDIRVRLLRGIVEIGGWKLIRSVLPEWVSAWQQE